MKTYKLVGNEFKAERALTQQQKQTLKAEKRNERLAAKQGQKLSVTKIEKQFEKPSKMDETKLNEIWERVKPKEEGVKVIQSSITIDDNGKERGIVNYRDEKGNHKQIRF